MTKLSTTLILAALLFALLGVSEARAQIISPSSQEVMFSYEAEFEVSTETFFEKGMEGSANDHAGYLFGVMASIELAEKYGIDSTLIGGIGAPRADMKIRMLDYKMDGKNVKIKYANEGRLLVHNNVAVEILKTRQFKVPLPVNGEKAYLIHCTDEHYVDFGDYWYFWDPYRPGCESLLQAPLVKEVVIKVSPIRQKKFDQWARLDLLRGANGNGSLFSMYIVHGFDEGPKAKDDGGRLAYNTFNAYLRSLGFRQANVINTFANPLKVFRKNITLPDGKVVNVEIRSLLADTSIDITSLKFAQFFKEAVETADVIYYSGHSGLGANLSIPMLEEKVGGFNFPKNKRQIFYFEACSSYSYYLPPFAAEKTRAKIDIMTNGLASYFETANLVLHGFVDVLISEEHQDIKWMDFLRHIEEPLEGTSFLLNVGGV